MCFKMETNKDLWHGAASRKKTSWSHKVELNTQQVSKTWKGLSSKSTTITTIDEHFLH